MLTGPDTKLTRRRRVDIFAAMPRIPTSTFVITLALMLGLCPGLAQVATASDTIYSFVDGNGVIHFSNAPTDPRYKKVSGAARPPSRVVPSPPTNTMHQAITKNSAAHQVDPNLVRALIKAESSFDAGAVSRKGAVGLMQLMPDTILSLRVANPYDPEQNIAGGVRHLRYLLDRFQGNVPLALAAYNAGETRVSRNHRIPRIGETREYVRRVLRFYKDYRQQEMKSLVTLEAQPLTTRLQYVSSN
jgi:soluble lytic murein transglycosylase-like protein